MNTTTTNNTYSVTVTDNAEYWFKNGRLHRENGPAIQFKDGDNRWYKNGKLHRENGPAVDFPKGYCKKWYVNGTKLTKSQFKSWKRAKNYTNKVIELGSKIQKLVEVSA